MPSRLRPFLVLVILVLCALQPAPAAAGDKVWTTGGPEGGAVDALAISPNFAIDQTLFAGTNGGGVWKTTDGGANWYFISPGWLSQVVYSMAVSPNYAVDHTVLAGTNWTGLYLSTNGGASWTRAPAPLDSVDEVHEIAFSPIYASDRTIFAATGSGMHRSTDGGASWVRMATGMTHTYVWRVALSPTYATDRIVLAGTDGGIYRSVDGGDTWAPINTGLTALNIRAIAFSPAFFVDRTIFAGTKSSGVFRTTNGGESWQAINTGHTPQKDVWSIMVSPNFAVDNTVFTGCPSWQGFKSTNRGDSWTMYQFNIDWLDEGNRILPDVWAMAISPSFATDRTLFAGCFGTGMLKSTDAGATWSITRHGMRAQRVQVVVPSPNFASDRTVYVGMNGGGVFYSNDGGTTWHNRSAQMFNLMDTYVMAISPNFSVDRTLYAGNPMGGGGGRHGLSRSTDGGISWTTPETGLGNKNVRALAVSPAFATDGTVFVGTGCLNADCNDPTSCAVFKSTDRGDTWFVASANLPKKALYSFAISPNYTADQTLYAGTWEGGVWRSADGGVNWMAVNNGLSDNRFWSVAVSPNYPSDQTVFAGAERGLFRSTDGGASWLKLTSTLGTRRISSIAISPYFASDRTLYVGSNFEGAFVSTDGGNTWRSFSAGLGHTYVQALALTGGPTPTLFAGTVGGSVWQYSFGGAWAQNLGTGWQLISIPRVPSDPSPAAVLSSIAGHYDAVCAFDPFDQADPWKRYQPSWPFSDLSSLTERQGFWVRMTSAATLVVDEDPPSTTSIPLAAGWNLIGYPASASRPVADALASIAGRYTLMYTYLGSGAEPWRRYDPTAPPYVNTLTTLDPGRGVWIRVAEACTLMVPY